MHIKILIASRRALARAAALPTVISKDKNVGLKRIHHIVKVSKRYRETAMETNNIA